MGGEGKGRKGRKEGVGEVRGERRKGRLEWGEVRGEGRKGRGKKCKEKSGKMEHMIPSILCPLTYHQGWSNHFQGEVLKQCLQSGLLFRLAQASP